MQELNGLKQNGEKGTLIKQIRLTPSQIARLEMWAKSSGFNTISSYIRHKLFNEPSADLKLNEILKILKEKEDEDGE